MEELPEAFVNEMKMLLHEEAGAFFDALAWQPQTSVRLNSHKPAGLFGDEEKVPWCRNGYYLRERPSFIADPLFHAGAYYVQESSSMFLEEVVRQLKTMLKKPLRVLDLCAAPGGKSTVLLDQLEDADLLVSNEAIKSRADVLRENMHKWGRHNVFITHDAPKSFSSIQHYFDLMLIDAPCSGEGMFRKNPRAVQEWSPAHVSFCRERQQRILADVWPSLKPGGYLIFSTCTYNVHENEENISWLAETFGMEPVRLSVQESWQISSSGASFRFYPHRVRGEGLFLCCLRKPKGDEMRESFKGSPQALPKSIRETAGTWLKAPEQFGFFQAGKNLFAIHEPHVRDHLYLSGKLNIISAGIEMGTLSKDLFQPAHALALNLALGDHIRRIETDKAFALRYLKKDVLPHNPSWEKGLTLLTYKGLGLGWANVLPNRVNNYLPAHLRILKDIAYA